jgi:MFS family permease
MTSRVLDQTSEWRAHWPLIVCGMLGISTPMIAIYALGQFLLPLEQEFGWSRTQASMGLSISLIVGFVASPLIGRIVDRINVRWLALPGLVLLGFAIAAFSLATDNIAGWIGLWCLHALASALVAPTIWLAVVSAAFERNRSLAIAICLSGTAIGSGFGPLVARILLDAFDWRTAFQLLGLLWVMPALLFAALFFFDRRPRTTASLAHAQAAGPSKGGIRAVLLSPTFLKLAVVVAVTGLTGSAFSLHLVPALSDKGISLAQAATLAGIAGLSSIPGKLAAGALLDRYGAPRVATLIMGLFAAASILFAVRIDGAAVAMVACVMFGISTGATFALGAVLTTKLFSASVFGVVYGTMMSIYAVAAAIGPLAISAVYDASGSYSPAFWSGVAAAVLAAVLLSNLLPVADPA